MRSVVVVLPASMCDMIPMFRVSSRQHSWAMALLGVVSIFLAYGAARRRARPAMLGLVVLGVVALAIALFGDLPDTRSTGVIGQRYEEAAAQAGAGFYFETAGGVLLVLAGVGGLVLLPPAPRKPATTSASEPG